MRIYNSLLLFYVSFGVWIYVEYFFNPERNQTSNKNYLLELIKKRLKNYKKNMSTVCSCHATYAFQSESTLYSSLNVKELPARSRRKIWSLSDCNWTQTQNHLVRKWTLNDLAKLVQWLSLAKWLSVRLWAKWFWVQVQLQSLEHVKHKIFNFRPIKKIFQKLKANENWAMVCLQNSLE